MRAALLMLLTACGCTAVEPGSGARSSFHLGATSVRIPQIEGNLSAATVSTFGVGWDDGPYVGWRSSNWIAADPANCQLLIVIREAVQTANAVQIINALEGQQPCIVDYTDSLRR